MSSPFQKSFSAKSPITTSPLRAGGYGSGVDGMQYVSPKQPESNILPASKPKKEEKTPEPKPILPIVPRGNGRIYDDFGDDSSDDGGGDGNYLLETQVLTREEPGEGFEFKGSLPTIWGKMGTKEQAKYGTFEVFEKDSIDYINNYERINGKGSWKARGRTKSTIYNQDQERKIKGNVVGDWYNVGKEYLKK